VNGSIDPGTIFRNWSLFQPRGPDALNAHFDGQSIVLDEPFELPSNARLLVTVVSPLMDSDRAQWSDLAGSGLALAYGDDEPEYRLTDVRRP
jgi:hypothetical protein